MSQNFIPIKVSAQRRLPQKEFKLPVEESIKIIDEVRKIQKHAKIIRPDQNRKQYQNLLEWVNTNLQSVKQLVRMSSLTCTAYTQQRPEQQTVDQEVQMEQRRIIQTLMMQMMEMFKRQCKEKSQLMQIIFDFFNQTINMYSKHYEKEYIDTLKNYNIELMQLEGDYQVKLNECNRRISYLESEKETKWKNIYMLAKDNRILRRQKGKLLRLVQEQDQKIKLLENQLCQVVKENEMNKLVIRFENDSENLKVFMKNRLALMKFEKIIEKFPKKAMKVLNNDLLKLQIEELNSLDSKIDYIKRVITQTGDIFDEYQDLNQLMARPNNMVFNVYTQTDPEDVEPPKEYRDVHTSYDMEFRLKRFDTWEQIYDIKVVGWPQMREKHVYMKDPNKKYTTKPSFLAKRQSSNQPRDYFLLQISSGQVRQSLNVKAHIRSEQFNRVLMTGVTFNPWLKDKTKLYFVMPYQNRIIENDPTDDMDLIFKKTLPIGTKKQKQAFRKSQTMNLKQSSSRINTLKSSQKQRNSEAVTIERNFSEVTQQDEELHFQQSPTIIQKSEIDSSMNTEEQVDQVDAFDSEENEEPYEMHNPKFNKKRRSFKRGTELISLNQGSQTQKTSIFKEQKVNDQSSSSRYSMNIDDHSQFQKIKKQQRVSTSGSTSQKKFKKQPVALNKINRIKTSQNVRKSNMSHVNNKTTMDEIYEQPDENNEDNRKAYQWESLNKTTRMSYMPSPKSLSKSKFSQTFGNVTNLSNSKENYMNELQGILAQRNQKYHTINPANPNSVARKISKLALRNSSFNINKFKHRQSANIDTYSINSRISSQNHSSFNYKLYLNEMDPKKSFQILQSQIMNPVTIKNFQVKKLTDKIIKSMYTRRKQLLSSQTSTSLKVFIQHFLKQIYGNNWKGEKNLLRYAFTIDDRETSPSIKTFSLMLNTNVQIEYLEDLFRLYVTMLEKNEFSNCENPLIASKTKGAAILKYLLSVYFDEVTANDIQQNLPFMNQFQVDLNEIFIVVETHVRRYTVETQIYSFLARLLPENQSFIQFGQMKEILYFFKNDLKYHAHIARLKYFFKTYGKIVSQQQQALANKMQQAKTARASNTGDKTAFQTRTQLKDTVKDQAKQNLQILPIHRVCLYLKRYQWTEVMQINSHIQQKYHKLVGVFIQQQSIKFITRYCSIIQQRMSKKKTFYQSGSIGMSISASQQQQSTTQQSTHPLMWLLFRTRQLIRNYYRYKGDLERHLLMFVHMAILNYELDVNMNEVLSESMSLMNLEYKRLRTKEEVDQFMKD